ncbi:MAG: rod shape-determining protein [Oscillospiraceae bacterium]|jgi:rod shape-determining protein MreB|nr:rod shape-determining protein [Oscillospiraceae bacterium]
MSVDIGIDLGTTSIIIYMSGKGIVLKEPTVATIDARSKKIIAFGKEALKAVDRIPPFYKTVYPLIDGVVSDHYVTEFMIKHFMRMISQNLIVKPRVSICIPSGVTDVEVNAVIDAVSNSGARKIYLIEEPIAGAIGAGLDLSLASGKMLLDLGGGTSDVAVISMNGIASKASLKGAGKRLDEDLIRYLKNKYNILIGMKTAEEIKKLLGNVYKPKPEVKYQVKGKNAVTGFPEAVIISEADTAEAYRDHIIEISQMVRQVMERTSPELISDIAETGMVLTGGTSLLRGLPELLGELLNIRTLPVEDPINCVAIGTGKAFDYLNILSDGFIKPTAYK